MSIWLVIGGMALVTYGTRLLPLTAIDSNALPVWVRRGLAYVPVAVLSAIIGPSFVPHSSWGDVVLDERLLAGLVAVGVAWRYKNTVVTILVGMVALLVLQALFNGV